eukprot:TRINITY_DN28486_c0_g2_i1.p1 TRINITY_DN28486_c0_g2~~TRINITY_DN28486_c0_g2_i1.p1  ORF type:complete len:247 (-),score=34.21 TRINITY_DN28486_c0_g2_i1:79-819(-)
MVRHGEVWARPFAKSVCFAHGNGRNARLLETLSRARQDHMQPARLLASVPPQETFPFGGKDWLPMIEGEELSNGASVVDLAQCFPEAGRLTKALVYTVEEQLGSLAIQIYRTRRHGVIDLCGDFEVVASSDAIHLEKAANLGVYSQQHGGPYRWELLLHQFNMFFEAGDCLGWQSLGRTLLARSTKVRRPRPSCRAARGPQLIGDIVSLSLEKRSASQTSQHAWGVMAYYQEPDDMGCLQGRCATD